MAGGGRASARSTRGRAVGASKASTSKGKASTKGKGKGGKAPAKASQKGGETGGKTTKRAPLKQLDNFNFEFEDAAPKATKRILKRKAVQKQEKIIVKKRNTKKVTLAVKEAKTEPPKPRAAKLDHAKRAKRKHQSAKKHAFVSQRKKAPVPTFVQTPTLAMFSPDASCDSGSTARSYRRRPTNDLKANLAMSPATPTASLMFDDSLDNAVTPKTRGGKKQARRAKVAAVEKPKDKETKKRERAMAKSKRKRSVGTARLNKSFHKTPVLNKQDTTEKVTGYGIFISPPRNLSLLVQKDSYSLAPDFDEGNTGVEDAVADVGKGDGEGDGEGEVKGEEELVKDEEGEGGENVLIPVATLEVDVGKDGEGEGDEKKECELSPTTMLLQQQAEDRRRRRGKPKPVMNEEKLEALMEIAERETLEAKRFYDEIDNEPLESFFEIC